MSTPLDTYMRVGGRKYTESDRSSSLTLEYIGATSTIVAAMPSTGETWGSEPGIVTRVDPVTLGISGYTFLTVVVEDKYGETATVGTVTEVAYELEWVPIRRPLLEHPKFQTGATFALTATDLVLLAMWKQEPSTDDRIAFKVFKRDSNGNPTGAAVTLSTAAQKYANYVLRNIEAYDDFAPIARKSKTYAGGPPATASAGAKQSMFSGFPMTPSGYEWLKTADRNLRAAGQRNWQKSEELTGATKVLIDNVDLYL